MHTFSAAVADAATAAVEAENEEELTEEEDDAASLTVDVGPTTWVVDFVDVDVDSVVDIDVVIDVSLGNVFGIWLGVDVGEVFVVVVVVDDDVVAVSTVGFESKVSRSVTRMVSLLEETSFSSAEIKYQI